MTNANDLLWWDTDDGGCKLVQGDPGRTLVLANARRWGSRSAAWRALNKAKQPNKHFRFRNAKVVQVKGEAGV